MMNRGQLRLAALLMVGCGGSVDAAPLDAVAHNTDVGGARAASMVPVAEGVGLDAGESAPLGPCDGEPRMTMGTGDSTFEPIAGGAELPIVYGPQGGWHIWGGLEVFNTGNVGTINLRYYLGDNGTTVSMVPQQRVRLVADSDDECRHSFWGITAFLAQPDVNGLANGDCDTPPEVLAHRELCVDAEVRDQNDVSVKDTRCFTAVVWDEDPTEIDEACLSTP